MRDGAAIIQWFGQEYCEWNGAEIWCRNLVHKGDKGDDALHGWKGERMVHQ